MASAAFLVQFHHQYLVGRDGELVKRKYGAFLLVSCNHSGIVVSPERKNNILLNGCTLHHLLIHDFESHEIHLERHIGRVPDLRVEIEQPVMGIKPAQEVLDAESLASDMLDMASVLLVDAPVNQLHEFGRFATQLLQIDVKGVVRTVHLAAVMDKVFHLHIEQ